MAMSIVAASSGLTGEAGGDKALRLLFEADEEDDPHARRQRRSKSRHEARSAASSEGISQARAAPRLGPTRVALNFAVPRRALETCAFPSCACLPPAVSASDACRYADLFLESVELIALPIRNYWDVEDFPATAWRAPAGGGSLARAIQGTGAATLAEAWTHSRVCGALLRTDPVSRQVSHAAAT